MHPTLIKQFTAARQMCAETNKQTKKKYKKSMALPTILQSTSVRITVIRLHQYDAPVSVSHKRLLHNFFCLIRTHSQIIMCGYYHVTPVWFLSWLLLSVPAIFSVELRHVLILPSGADSNILQFLLCLLSASQLTGFASNPIHVCPHFISESSLEDFVCALQTTCLLKKDDVC